MINYCAECAKDGKSCCNCNKSGIIITLHDALRIKKATGLEFNEFIEFSKVPDESWLNELKENKDPLFDVYIDGKILQLKLTSKGCIFLSDTGCTIFNFRPGLCRAFPLLLDEDKISMIKADKIENEECVLIKNHFNDSDVKGILKDMNENEEDFMEFLKRDSKEFELYKKYAPLLNQGMPFEEIIKKFNITV